jgi:hypothetical protein
VPLGLGEGPLSPRMRPGERPALVPEELALDELARKRRHVDGDEGRPAPGPFGNAAPARRAPCPCRSRRQRARAARASRGGAPGRRAAASRWSRRPRPASGSHPGGVTQAGVRRRWPTQRQRRAPEDTVVPAWPHASRPARLPTNVPFFDPRSSMATPSPSTLSAQCVALTVGSGPRRRTLEDDAHDDDASAGQRTGRAPASSCTSTTHRVGSAKTAISSVADEDGGLDDCDMSRLRPQETSDLLGGTPLREIGRRGAKLLPSRPRCRASCGARSTAR